MNGASDDGLDDLFAALNVTSKNASKLIGGKSTTSGNNKQQPKRLKAVSKKKKTVATKSSGSLSSSKSSSQARLDFEVINKQVFDELNKVRSNPKSLIQRIKFIISHMKGNVYYPPNSKIGLNYKEGPKVLHETIEFLQKQTAVKSLKYSADLSKAADLHCKDQSATGSTGHIGKDGKKPAERMNSIEGYAWKTTCGENIMYGRENGRDIVAALIIDDGVPSRGHRKNMFSEEYGVVGIASATHPKYRTMCVLDFAASFVKKGDD